ncbi:EAL domain-containing protein [Caloramator sp. E03]|uniref:EAL domain-containing protein n=1 Tax=Caloramator sp. E03 TaxID=2576307 RepID=UPI001110DA52|nr:EAL domain-containing protein [Caloramator sp. E03]QCX34410.1 EAL domain-containing protein [Caloramator sp. E03]
MGLDNKVINFKGMILIPLIVAFISVMGVGVISSFFGIRILIEGAKYYGIDITKMLAEQIESNSLSLEAIDEAVENRIKVIGQAIILSSQKPSSSFLKKLAKDFDVYEINWFSKDGVILYSNIDEYVGFKVPKNHPIEKFMNSNLKIYVEEDIRKDTESDRFLRYGYIKNTDGSFIQVGILSDDIFKLKGRFQYQKQIDSLRFNKNVVFAYYYDAKLRELARMEKGSTYKLTAADESYKKALNHSYSVEEIRDSLSGKRFMKVTVPIIYNNYVIGILVVGVTLDNFYSITQKYIIASSLIAFILCCFIIIFLNRKIKRPLESLSVDVIKIDLENNLDYRLNIEKDDNFKGLKSIINEMLDRISKYFYDLKESHEEIAASNEELAASLEQLTATEEELKAQYDELQSYSEKIEELQQKYDIAIKASNSGVWEIDLNNMTINISENILDILGKNLVRNGNVHDVLDKILLNEDKEKLIQKFRKHQEGEKEYINHQVKVVDKNGNIKWLLIAGRGIFDSKGIIKRLYGIFIDTTDLKKKERQIEYMAYHDQLTGLPNRAMFNNIINEELGKGSKGALMLVDLDNFKNVNDIMGHVCGDELLKKLGDIFKTFSNDKLFFFRFGGDEFLILIKDEDRINIVSKFARAILEAIKHESAFVVQGINVTACIGIAFYPKDGSNLKELLMKADTAMYRAKYEGKNKYLYFYDEMTDVLKERVEIEGLLKKAVENNEINLLYQPIVDAKSGEIASFEALIRLKNSNISPAKFIPIAEETNLIIPIGYCVIKEVARQISRWKECGFKIRPVSINVSAKQIKDDKFIDTLKGIIEEYKLDAKSIEIEITESIMLEKKDEIMKKIEYIKKLGFSVALDDFGTGYSSLNYLTFLNIDKIKLDKSLCDKFLEDENIKVMESIIMLIQSLNLKVTAEGIEDVNKLNILKKIGCDYVQGYVFSKPLPKEEINNLLNKE